MRSHGQAATILLLVAAVNLGRAQVENSYRITFYNDPNCSGTCARCLHNLEPSECLALSNPTSDKLPAGQLWPPLFVAAGTGDDGLTVLKYGDEFVQKGTNGFISGSPDFSQCRQSYWQKGLERPHDNGRSGLKLLGIPFDGSCYQLTPQNTPNCPEVEQYAYDDPCKRGHYYTLNEFQAVRAEITSNLCDPRINDQECAASRGANLSNLFVSMLIMMVLALHLTSCW